MASEKVGPVEIGGRALACQFCGHSGFHTRRALLHAEGFAWNNRSAFCYICDACGYIHWFLPAEPLSPTG